eukprot:1572209-Alexandrium_andersonii.AAC.1
MNTTSCSRSDRDANMRRLTSPQLAAWAASSCAVGRDRPMERNLASCCSTHLYLGRCAPGAPAKCDRSPRPIHARPG